MIRLADYKSAYLVFLGKGFEINSRHLDLWAIIEASLNARKRSMATQQVTIDLPETIFDQLIRWAEATRQPIEDLVAQSVVSNLPPMVEQGSAEVQADLLNMQNLSIEDLLTIAHSQIAPEVYQAHVVLLEKNQAGSLTVDERGDLRSFQAVCDRLMLRKAYAWSMLRWRGYPIPAMKDLAIVG
jgi:hypothetical protein